MACLEDISNDVEQRHAKLEKIIKKWYNDDMVKVMTGRKAGDWDKLYSDILPQYDYNLSVLPTFRELRKLDKHVDIYLRNMKHVPGKLEKLIKLPQVLLDKYPITKKWFHELSRAADFNRAHRRDVESDLNEITRLVNIASGETGLFKSGFKRSEASKEYQNLLVRWEKEVKNNGEAAGNKYWEENIAILHKNGEVPALQALHELMTSPWKAKTQDAKKKLGYNQAIVEAATIWHEGSKGNKPLKEQLWKILGDGLKDSIEMLKRSNEREIMYDQKYGKNVLKVNELEKLYNDYFSSKNAPKYDKNYFPRQVIDIAPTMAQLSNDIWSNKAHNNSEAVSKYIDKMIDNVTESLKEPANIYERGVNQSTKVSSDVINILDNYAKNAIRFNHNARVSKLTTGALKDLYKLKGEGYQRHAKFLAEYITDTHKAALGLNFRDAKLSTISRAITSFEFISKLGFNLRGAFKNSTQSLQHWVWWGTAGLKRVYDARNSADKKAIIASEMKQLGYEFVNIQELAQPKEMINNLKISEAGGVIEKAPGIGTTITDMLESVARVSGKPMEYVENKFNRGAAFKIAFLSKYESMLRSDAALRRAIEAEQKAGSNDIGKLHKKRQFYDKSGNVINKQWTDLSLGERTRNEIIRKSSAYATDMVREIHYLYDPYAKPMAIRGPVGSVLGQFSTYSINFFNYQQKIAKNAVNSGEWLSPEAWRLYRLGSLYAFVTGLSALTNTSYNNIIENDTWERGKQFAMYFGGTPEEKDKAFFGKGPVLGTFGGPFISDIMTLGSITGFMEMNSTDFQNYRTGYKSYAERADSDPAREFVRVLNTAAERMIYTNLPRIINGTSIPTVIGQDLGLYGTPDLKGLKQNLLYPLQNTPLPKVNEYFTPSVRGKTGGSKYRKSLKDRGKSNRGKSVYEKSSSTYSQAELDIILRSLGNLT